MKIGFTAVVLVFALSFIGQGCDSDDEDNGGNTGNTGNAGNAGNAGSGSLCENICAISDSLDCENEANCVADCEGQMSMAAACQSEVDAVMSCTAARSVSDFECDEFGDAVLKEGVCEAETTALMNCFMSM